MSPRLRSGRIREVLGLGGEGHGLTFRSYAVDSREVRPDALFFALPGARTHGIEHVEEAHRRGALGAVVPADRDLPELPIEWFPVEDTREALTRLAVAVRREAGARVVGITGSSGKTTVKEMTAAALEPARRVHRTPGNRNSQVGLPLAVLAAPADADVWILELGTSAPGEIAALTAVAAPDDAVITTVGPAHLEELGSVEGVLDEKLDLLRGASPEGAALVGERPSELGRAARAIRPDARVVGLDVEADVRPDRWEVGGRRVTFERGGVRFRVEAGGEHHLRDALLAVAVAEVLGVEGGAAARGLANFRPSEHRGELVEFGGLTVVADCYNANPESFDAVVAWCADAFVDRRRAAAVGSMLELGELSGEEHRRVARLLLDRGFGPIVATGEFVEAFRSVAPGDERVIEAEDAPEAGRRLARELAGDEVVLVKGSRGARMEGALDVLRSRFGDSSNGSGRRGGAACAAGKGGGR